MMPKPSVTNSTIHTNGLRGLAQSRVDATMPARIISPPIVGVPFFKRCDSGPSLRIGWPLPCLIRSAAMTEGPKNITSSSAVAVAPPARKVM